jgi:lysosomal acid lipase/cholesteryl ester hydrolase
MFARENSSLDAAENNPEAIPLILPPAMPNNIHISALSKPILRKINDAGSFILQSIIELIRTVCLCSALSIIVLIAMMKHLFRIEWSWQSLHNTASNIRKPLGYTNIVNYITQQGYEVDPFKATTSDGFILTIYRIKAKAVDKNGAPVSYKGPALLIHGLLNTCIAFLVNGDSTSLAYILANEGYDVYLANNRATRHSREHLYYTPNDLQYWNWSIDDLVYDVVACYRTVLANSPQFSQLVYVGHSQGVQQLFAALSTHPMLQQQTKLAVCLAPAAYTNKLTSIWLRGVTRLFHYNSELFYLLIGRKCFIPLMEEMRHYINAQLWGFCGSLMLNELLNWSTQYWCAQYKNIYFQEVPSLISTRNLAHWLQQCETGRFQRYDYGSAELNNLHYGRNSPPNYDLSSISCPVALVWGSADKLINLERLARELPNVVYANEVADHFHLDALNAERIHQTLYPQLIELMQQESYQVIPKEKLLQGKIHHIGNGKISHHDEINGKLD